MRWLDRLIKKLLGAQYRVCGRPWCIREQVYDYRCFRHFNQDVANFKY